MAARGSVSVASVGEVGWRPVEVHPLAALFPALAPDDLASLAEHIKANGLQNSIVIDAAGVLIDGRMRLAACEIAGVEPRYEWLNGHDAEAFIWGANAKRRQMSKGALAMVGAVGFVSSNKTPSPKGGRPSQGHSEVARLVGVNHATMGKAFLVKEYAPDLVDSVIAGTIQLDAAHETAQARKREAEWRDNGLELLRAAAPDLAARVVDGEIDLKAGRAQLDERVRAEEAQRDSALVGLLTLTTAGVGFEKSDALAKLPEWLSTDDGEKHLRRYFGGGISEATEKLAAAQRGLTALLEVCDRIGGTKRSRNK